MGLDMYLTKHYYIGGKYDENPDRIIEIPVNKFGRQMNWQFRVGDIENISTLAMQWRKAYSIDDWFMKKHDWDQTYFYVSQESILELYDIVSKVRADHSKANELLPIGITPEEWYWDDLETTYEGLGKLVAEIKSGDANFDLYYEHSA